MPKSPSSPVEYISIPAYARQLGISRIAVYQKVKQGRIPAKKIGRNYVVILQTPQKAEKTFDKSHVSIPQLAKHMGISRMAVYKKIKSGQIQAQKMGRNYVIDFNDFSGKRTQKTQSLKKKVYVQGLLTIPELARKMGMSRVAVYKKVKSGQITAKKVGRNYTVPAQDFSAEGSPFIKKKKKDIQDYISIPQMAKNLGLSRFEVYQKVKKGTIKGRKVGRNYVIAVEDIRLAFGDET
ncbi:MAG: helix-turn-helix domain-containing protein, partial [Candidatus Omnitrophica bacterium]|nr:helix-turn-helix domain-containing protein [Candidatus Omnitrophota bacterium]